MPYISQEKILSATNNGLDIIRWLFPAAADCDDKNKKKFKARGDEKSASATISFFKGVYWVKDFGGEPARAPIQLIMAEQNCTYTEALELAARQFNIEPETGTFEPQKPKYLFEERPAKEDEPEGEYYFDYNDGGFVGHDLESIFTPKVIEMCGAELLTKVLTKYHFHSCKSYTRIKERKAHTYIATPEHPIFVIEETGFKKIYQPLHPQKQYRFFYVGKREENFIHGYTQCLKAYNTINPVDDADYESDDENEKEKKRKENKLDAIILCTGGSDALNIAAIYFNEKQPAVEVIWLNSESAKLPFTQYLELKKKTKAFCNLPDIDATGNREAHKLAMQYLDMRTIRLPEELSRHNDWRGNSCKDVRDYLKHYTPKQFKKLVDTALEYQFWTEEPMYNRKGEPIMMGGRHKYGYRVSNVHLYNFLQNNGYSKFKMNDTPDDYFIGINGNIVSEIETKDVRTHINNFLEERSMPVELRNVCFRSPELKDGSLENMKVRNIDFTDYGKDFQFMFFKNEVWEVRPTGIKKHKHGEVHKYVWDKEVIPHRVTLHDDYFKITHQFEGDKWDIDITNNSCLFFRYLINASRVCWRDELEARLTHLNKEEREKYLEDNRFNIAGPELHPNEIATQKHHLINKIFSIGYLLHRYKDVSRAWMVFAMDNKLPDDGECNGGSGKSICYNQGITTVLMKHFYKDGRNKKITEDNHIFDGLTEFHRYIVIDDAHKYLDFHFFFGKITGNIEVNPKSKTPYTIPFAKAGKMCMTSNFVPRNIDASLERRLLYTVFSDYYHHNKNNEYNEIRQVSDDFKKNLFTDFTPDEWNLFLNFCAQCLRFYLSCDKKINPPMDNVSKRQMLDEMGDNFREWADVYFTSTDADDSHLDKLIPKKDITDSFHEVHKGLKITSQQFMKKLKTWCNYNGMVLNPKELLTAKKGETPRILRDHAGKTTEMLYISNDPAKLLGLMDEKGEPF